jgi:hypothetical protein
VTVSLDIVGCARTKAANAYAIAPKPNLRSER